MYERTLVNVKLERGSTFTFTCDLPYIVSILFTRVKLTCVGAENLHSQIKERQCMKDRA